MSAILTSIEKALLKVPLDYSKEQCPVPPITDKMGKHWNQPNARNFLFDDKSVVMLKVEFEALHEYSYSQPTGCYPGKMWKRSDRQGGWILCWYGIHPIEPLKYCSNHYRKLYYV